MDGNDFLNAQHPNGRARVGDDSPRAHHGDPGAFRAHARTDPTRHERYQPALHARPGENRTDDSNVGPESFDDLRRRRRADGVEFLVRSAKHLLPGERTLIESVFKDGKRVAELARLAALQGRDGPDPSMSSASERALRYRVRRLVRRVLSPQFQAVAAWIDLQRLTDPGRRGGMGGAPAPGRAGLATVPASFSGARRRVGETCFLHGLSIRSAARRLGLSVHTVRRHRDALAAMLGAFSPVPSRWGRGDRA